MKRLAHNDILNNPKKIGYSASINSIFDFVNCKLFIDKFED